MNKVLLLVVLCLVVPSLAVFRDDASWKISQKAPAEEVIEFRVALTQRNTDLLEKALYDVSTPSSVNYGKHWSIDEILDLIAPEPKVAKSVIKYLKNAGAFKISNERDFIKAQATVAVVESLFDVEMFEFVHKITGAKITRSKDIFVIPSVLKSKVDLIAGISELPFRKVQPKQHKNSLNKINIAANGGADPGIVVPETLYNLYNIPVGFPNNANTTLCLAEFQDDASYKPSDLKVFATQTDTVPINVDKVVGPFSPSQPDLESTLDVQYGGAVAQNASIWFWTVQGWMYEFATDLFATTPAPYIVSMSWGWTENAQCANGVGNCNGETSQQYVTRVNNEFAKIGLRGISLLAASGDQGAPGDANPGCSSAKHPINPIYPGASPYITSVGATMLAAPSADVEASGSSSSSPLDPPFCKKQKCATSTEEVVCTYPAALITSGGGFSVYSQVPQYQASAVSGYLSSGVALPPSQFFNASNRAFPDVSALGHNYVIFALGKPEQVDGTSCASPVFGGVVAMLNSIRFNLGKGPLGFLNPMLYQAYATDSTTFNDITVGNNKCTEQCCDKYGFVATKGYDPASGLGTPNFKSLAQYVESLN